jgi:hypothetical protein
MVVPATYNHIFWTGNTVAAIWGEADFLTKAMGLPQVTADFSSYRDVYTFIEKADLTLESTIITASLMLEVIWTLYTSEKELNDIHKNGSETIPDRKIDLWTRTCITAFRSRVVKLALSHRHLMRIYGSKKLPVRTQLLRDTKHYTQRTDDETTLYTNTWLRTDLVQITNRALVVKPFRREPP